MKRLNDYQRLIADVMQPPRMDSLLTQRNLLSAVGLAVLLPVVAFLLISYPLQAAFVILLGASILAISRG